MIQTGLIGQNIGYSYSPLIFNTYYRKTNIAAVHSIVDIKENQIIDFLKEKLNDPSSIGYNVTIPYKEKIIPLLDFTDQAANDIGAVNCIYKNAGNWIGTNTDYKAFTVTLLEHKEKIGNALLLGTGGAAKAVHFALKEIINGEIFIWARNEAKLISFLTEHDGKKWLGERADLIVNCTPIGTKGNLHSLPDKIYSAITNSKICYDLVYNPPQTVFLEEAIKKGMTAINGLPMLINQAAFSFSFWYRKKMDTQFLNEISKQTIFNEV